MEQPQRPKNPERVIAATRYARNVALDQLADSEGYIAVLENQVQRMNEHSAEQARTITSLNENTLALEITIKERDQRITELETKLKDKHSRKR